MKLKDVNKYCELMSDIKRRTKLIYALHAETNDLHKSTTSVEIIYLQFRKILELVAFGSLIVNKEIYSHQYAKFATTWNAEYLLNDLNGLNPDFYPVPIQQVESKLENVKHELLRITENVLTRDEFTKLYKKCGAILHSENPFGRQINYEEYFEEVLSWSKKIVNLLNCHQVKFFNQNGFYLIQMGAEGTNPTCHKFGLAKS